jgi:hypothetical protein
MWDETGVVPQTVDTQALLGPFKGIARIAQGSAMAVANFGLDKLGGNALMRMPAPKKNRKAA